MSDGKSLIGLGNISKPATVLIEKISDALGGFAKPWQIERIARAEAKADLIRAHTRVEISEIDQRALIRMAKEEGMKQKNIESISAKAVSQLSADSNPEDMENDWLVHFFDRSRLVSDEQMQDLWAKILAGEANKPGTFSRKTLDLVQSLEKSDAELFTKFCTFIWTIHGVVTPLVLVDLVNIDSVYDNKEINFSTLNQLDDLGLIKFDNIRDFFQKDLPRQITVFYYGTPVNIKFSDDNNQLKLGKVFLTKASAELFHVSGSSRSDEYMSHVLQIWKSEGYSVSSPLSRNGF